MTLTTRRATRPVPARTPPARWSCAAGSRDRPGWRRVVRAGHGGGTAPSAFVSVGFGGERYKLPRFDAAGRSGEAGICGRNACGHGNDCELNCWL